MTPPQKKNKPNFVPAVWSAGTEQVMSQIVGTSFSRYRDCYRYYYLNYKINICFDLYTEPIIK